MNIQIEEAQRELIDGMNEGDEAKVDRAQEKIRALKMRNGDWLN